MCGCRQKGFSLLETLVAFTILALSLGVLAQVFSRGTQTVVIADASNRAVMLAESLMAQARVEPLGKQEQQGRQGDMHWRIHTVPYTETIVTSGTTTGRPQIDLQQIHVEVRWPRRGSEQTLELTTLAPMPPES